MTIPSLYNCLLRQKSFSFMFRWAYMQSSRKCCVMAQIIMKSVKYNVHVHINCENDQEVAGSIPIVFGNILSGKLITKYFSTVILSLPLIQEGQLSISGERMCTSTY